MNYQTIRIQLSIRLLVHFWFEGALDTKKNHISKGVQMVHFGFIL